MIDKRIVFVLGLHAFFALTAAANDLSNLLEQIQGHYDLMQHSLITGHTGMTITRPDTSIPEHRQYEHSIGTDGVRLVTDVRAVRESMDNKNSLDLDREYDLWDGQRRYKYAERGLTGPKMSTLTVFTDYDINSTPIPFNVLKDGFWRGTAYLETEGFASVLLNNAETVKFDKNFEELIGGNPCYRLELITASAKRTFWVAKEFDNGIVRVKIEYAEGVSFNGNPTGGKELHSIEYEVQSFLQIEDHWIPREVHARFRVVMPNGTTILEDTQTTTCLEATLVPDYDKLGSFKPNFPNGVRTEVMGYPITPAVSFEWDSDKSEIRSIDNSHLEISVAAEKAQYGASIVRRLDDAAPVQKALVFDTKSVQERKVFLRSTVAGTVVILGILLAVGYYVVRFKLERTTDGL